MKPRRLTLVPSPSQNQEAKVNVRLVNPGRSQTASSIPAACPGMNVIVSWRTRLSKPRYGG